MFVRDALSTSEPAGKGAESLSMTSKVMSRKTSLLSLPCTEKGLYTELSLRPINVVAENKDWLISIAISKKLDFYARGVVIQCTTNTMDAHAPKSITVLYRGMSVVQTVWEKKDGYCLEQSAWLKPIQVIVVIFPGFLRKCLPCSMPECFCALIGLILSFCLVTDGCCVGKFCGFLREA